LIEKLAALPGVQSVSVYNGALPISGGETPVRVRLPNQSGSDNGRANSNIAQSYAVGPQYFLAMGIHLKQGRAFDAQDRHSSERVVIVDEHLAEHLFPNGAALGQRLSVALLGTVETAEIVGIVNHVKHFGLDTDSQAPIQLQVYRPFAQLPDVLAPILDREVNLVMRANIPAANLIGPIRRAVGEIDRHTIVYDTEEMDAVLADSQTERRFSMALLGAFAGIALLLASVGIYGVVSYLVSQRTHEIGIRIALGAQRKDVLQLILSEGAKLAAAGLIVGLGAALLLTRLMASLLFGVRPTDPLTFAVVAVLLNGIALLACYVPAHRAMRVDPMAALRHE
jgi:predicted permease